MDYSKEIKKLEEEIKELKEEIEDRASALPAHSFKPSIVQEIEELEEMVKEKRERLGSLRESL
jgi:peptidoglycan hydrolase CwlO-like protein